MAARTGRGDEAAKELRADFDFGKASAMLPAKDAGEFGESFWAGGAISEGGEGIAAISSVGEVQGIIYPSSHPLPKLRRIKANPTEKSMLNLRRPERGME
jgi:hypothetical protein